MTDRIIRVVLDPSGVKQGEQRVRGSLQGIDRSAKGTSTTLRSLAQVAGLVVGAFGIRQLLQTADAYTLLGNRLRIVTDSIGELNAVQDEVVRIAQRTRSDLLATGELYARVARSSDQLGLSQREILDITETVNQAIQVSGATAAEAGAGVIQFSQGLAAGALRGDELRSVLEQMPRLARALADGLGVTIGELRELGNEGKLTTDLIVDALQSQAGVIQDEFALINPTVGQAMQTVRNFATVVVGSFNEAAGVTEGLVEIFQLTDEETIALAATVRDLGLSFREFVEVATVAVANFADTVPSRFAKFRADIAGTLGILFGNDAVVDAAIEDRLALEDEIRNIQARLDEEFELIRRNAEARREDLENRAADLDETPGGGGGGVAVDEAALKKQADFLEGLQREAAALAIEAALLEDSEAALTRYNIALDAAKLGDEEFVRRAQELGEAIVAQGEALAQAQARAEDTELLASLEEELELLGLSNRERAIEIQLRQLSAEATDAQRESVAELAGAIHDQEEALRNQSDFLESIADQAARNIQDAFADFLFDPFEEGLEGMARNFVNVLHRMASEALAARLFENLFAGVGDGGGLGGFFQSILGTGRQHGGGVRPGEAYMVGEDGPEPFVPTTSGQIIPASQASGMAPPPANLNVTSVNVFDSSEIPAAMQSAEGEKVFFNFITTKRTAINQVLRGGR